MSKICNRCLWSKDDSEYYLVNKRGKKTLYHICKLCCKDKNASLKDYGRDWELKSKYGISLAEYTSQSLLRDNKCDICSIVVQKLHVDHSHVTGKVRGYLCGSCNRGIGLLKDSSIILQKAVEYLQQND